MRAGRSGESAAYELGKGKVERAVDPLRSAGRRTGGKLGLRADGARRAGSELRLDDVPGSHSGGQGARSSGSALFAWLRSRKGGSQRQRNRLLGRDGARGRRSGEQAAALWCCCPLEGPPEHRRVDRARAAADRRIRVSASRRAARAPVRELARAGARGPQRIRDAEGRRNRTLD